jgi:Kef-type K+ transport system membrane component KefB
VPTNFDLALHLYLQLAIILIACRVCGYLLRYLGQTQVVGEMIAGVLLGPSLLGTVAPDAQRWLFPTTLLLTEGGATVQVPHPSMTLLYTLGQLGLVLYMFVVGAEFNTNLISHHLRETGVLALSSIVIPVVLGGLLGYNLASQTGLFPPGVSPPLAALFFASAMSITAFPVLARIIYDLGLTRAKIGTLTIGAAATGQVAASFILAIVLATSSGSLSIAALAIVGGLGYTLLMALFGPALLAPFTHIKLHPNQIQPGALAVLLVLLMASAALADAIGIYSVFGAFILGAVMPRGGFLVEAVRTIERLTVILLLPVFFIYSGLNTHLDLLTNQTILVTALVVVAIAFLGKGGAVLLAGWLSGTSLRTATAIGVLMNARGLMELILINIGLDRGIITPALFSILVLMTIVTTMFAAPLFKLVYRADDLPPLPRTAPS